MKHALLSFAILLFLIGCGPAGPGPGNIRLKQQVTPQEAVGVWKLRGDCLTWLGNKEGYQAQKGSIHEIELRPDGTCHFSSVLQYPTRHVDCEGTWKLVPDSGKTSRLDLGLKVEGGYSLSLDFTDLFGAIEVFEYWGDPDACQILRYEKTGNP